MGGQRTDGSGDRFFKYNDELVTEVPATEVLEDRTGSDANPALLCYVRKGKDLVQTLHRRMLEADSPKDGNADGPMGGGVLDLDGQRGQVMLDDKEDREAVEHVEDIVMDGQSQSQGHTSNARHLDLL